MRIPDSGGCHLTKVNGRCAPSLPICTIAALKYQPQMDCRLHLFLYGGGLALCGDSDRSVLLPAVVGSSTSASMTGWCVYRIGPVKLAAIGFSAGISAASLATRHAAGVYHPVDMFDALPTRPLVAGLMYPVVTLGRVIKECDSWR
jgi:hypothetical protein